MAFAIKFIFFILLFLSFIEYNLLKHLFIKRRKNNMHVHEYERNLGFPLEKIEPSIWSIVNNKGNISVIKKDCFIPKGFPQSKSIFIKEKGQDKGHDILRFNKTKEEDFCSYFDLSVDKCKDVGFIHFDKNILKQEWNKLVDSFKISRKTPIYLYDIHLNDFSELLEFIKENVNINFEDICIKTKKDDISISIIFDNDTNLDEIEFSLVEDDAPSLEPYASNWNWDDGIEGTISLEKLNEYIREYGGLDLLETYLDYPYHFLLPLLTNISDEYLYEIDSDMRIIAYKILKEDNEFWYTKEKKFSKDSIKNVSQFNPRNFSSIYTNDLDELIKVYNSNLEKFYVKE